MLDISVVILTFNEEKHIERCLNNVLSFAKEVFVIDCFSTDKTIDICRKYENVKVLQHKWENNYAKQFNWALTNSPITTKWVLRLDADEYLSEELISELEQKMPKLTNDITGIVINRFHIFLGKVMDKRYPTKMLRIFQSQKAKCEVRWMDEHMQLLEGKSVDFDNCFYDHNLNNISWFCNKHIGYAIREAVDLLDIELNLTGSSTTDDVKKLGKQAVISRGKKHKYASKPLFWRSFAYFLYRYFYLREFLDGKEGFLWSFLQGWWYRTLVDVKVFEIKQVCGNDKEKIKTYLKENYNVNLELSQD